MTGTLEYTPAELALAELVHTATCALQKDDSLPAPPWASAPRYMRETCLDGVRRAMAGETPEQHHQAWCDRLLADGWEHGEVKDYDRKTHPCLVPWAELPREQQAKDIVFLAVVRALAGEDA